ncbi:hypothetical protein [Hydrogenimonas sp.]
MIKLERYFWPKTAFLFYLNEEKIEAAFGFVERSEIDIRERRSFAFEKKSEMIRWYKEILHTYPKTYTAAVLDTINQGALPTCGEEAMKRFGVDEALVDSICIEGKWLVYVSRVEMKWFEQKFKEIEIDLLYSPFVLLYQRSKSLWEENPGLFLLHQKGVVFLAVISKERVWYAQVLLIDEKKVREDSLEEKGGEELSFDLDLLEEEGIEPISDVDLLGDFKEDLGGTGETGEEASALELLEYNLNLLEEIKDAVSRFYSDERFDHAFIEKVTIFDMDGLGDDFVRYIEDELFMEARMLRFDPIDKLSLLVPREVR